MYGWRRDDQPVFYGSGGAGGEETENPAMGQGIFGWHDGGRIVVLFLDGTTIFYLYYIFDKQILTSWTANYIIMFRKKYKTQAFFGI